MAVLGGKLLVDYPGQRVPVVDSNRGGEIQASIVEALGASNYTYADLDLCPVYANN